MHVLILGVAGMIDRRLTARLVADGNVGGRAIERLTWLTWSLPPSSRQALGARSIWSPRTWLCQARLSICWRTGPI